MSVRSCLPEHGSWQGTGLIPGLVGAQLGAAPLLLLVLGDSFLERPSSPSPQPPPAPSSLSHISGCSSHPPYAASWAVTTVNSSCIWSKAARCPVEIRIWWLGTKHYQ